MPYAVSGLRTSCSCSIHLLKAALPSNLEAMASNLMAMASNLLAMASNARRAKNPVPIDLTNGKQMRKDLRAKKQFERHYHPQMIRACEET